MEERTTAPPVPLPFDQESLSTLEYCKVNVRGEFQHDKIVYIGPRSLFKGVVHQIVSPISNSESD